MLAFEALNQIVHHFKETNNSPWNYLGNKIWMALSSFFCSLNSHREWEKFHQAILRLSTNLQRNILETALKQDMKMITYHLKESTAVWKTQDSQSTRHAEDQELDIIDAHPVLWCFVHWILLAYYITLACFEAAYVIFH